MRTAKGPDLPNWALLLLSVSCCSQLAAAPTPFRSHAPQRPLPAPARHEEIIGPGKFVSLAGADQNDGTEAKPWRTLTHALGQLRAGDTLYVRGGTYHEHVTANLLGTGEKPIVIRAYPSELVILDGGLPEFLNEPASAWEPSPQGVSGEYWSTKTYADLAPDEGEHRVTLLGNFADSMIPIQGYWNRADLQSDNAFFNLNEGAGETGKTAAAKHVYCGPGVWYDVATGRIHSRFAPTQLVGLGDNNYRGETDPRRIPLVLAPWSSGSVLTLNDCRYVHIQDIVLRGARQATLKLVGGDHLELQGLTVYGGHPCLSIDGVRSLRIGHTACRGLAAPWTFRGSLKYRSIESRLLSSGGWTPTGRDSRNWEIAYCEFTDSVDGIFIGNVANVSSHHNLVENISDDGVFVTAATGFDGHTPGGGHRLFQNRFARCLTTFAFGVGHGRQKILADGEPGRWGMKQLGAGLTITRNIFDFRQPVNYYWPTGPEASQEITSLGRFAGDHGSPGWEPMIITHNTILAGDPPRYEYGTDGFSRAVTSGTSRRVMNNVICQLRGRPGVWLPDGKADFAIDGNLLWGLRDGQTLGAPPKPRYPRDQTPPPASWSAHDQFADPQFIRIDSDWRSPVDLRLRETSPAVDRGVIMPDVAWDPLKPSDSGIPDIGAIPLGVALWPVGCHGRIDVCGNGIAKKATIRATWLEPESPESDVSRVYDKPAVVVTGYPAFEAPLVTYALRRHGVQVEEYERTWLNPREFAKYGLVVIDGSFARAGVTPTKFADDELPIVKRYLEEGGTLWLFRERHDLFASDRGRVFLEALLGSVPRGHTSALTVLQPEHAWIQSLQRRPNERSFLEKGGTTLAMPRGEVVIGDNQGRALLGQVAVGKGRIIYLGWSIAAFLPHGRIPSTVAAEHTFDDQMAIITAITQNIFGNARP